MTDDDEHKSPIRPSNDQDPENERGYIFRTFRVVGPFFTLGIQLAAAVALMFFIGRWLDERWGTAPWMMLTGTALGAIAGFYNFIKTSVDIGKKEENQKGHL